MFVENRQSFILAMNIQFKKKKYTDDVTAGEYKPSINGDNLRFEAKVDGANAGMKENFFIPTYTA